MAIGGSRQPQCEEGPWPGPSLERDEPPSGRAIAEAQGEYPSMCLMPSDLLAEIRSHLGS